MSDEEQAGAQPKKRTLSTRVKELDGYVKANQSSLAELNATLEELRSAKYASPGVDEERVELEKRRRRLGIGFLWCGVVSGAVSFAALIFKIWKNDSGVAFDGLALSVGAGFGLTFLLMRQAAQQYLREPTVERIAIAKANAKSRPASSATDPVEDASKAVDLVSKVAAAIKDVSGRA